MAEDRLYIIGVTPHGEQGLPEAAKRYIRNADMVFGGQRLLDYFPDIRAEKTVVNSNLSEITAAVKANLPGKSMVVLASGDPGFFGIARYLTEKVGKENIRIIPNVSSVQTAFARIGESWQDAVFASAHGRDIGSAIPLIAASNKIAILTDEKNNPAEIARIMLNRGISGYKAFVCQDLDMGSEKIEAFELHDLPGRSFSPLSVLVLLKEISANTVSPGIPDEEFYQRKPEKGLITKQEIRAVSLSKLRLHDACTVWDIGAGSGAVSVEASIHAPKGRIYAIEKNPDDSENIRKNIRKFGRYNIEVVEATAPDGLDSLPAPDAVFVGGSAGNMEQIVRHVGKKIKPGGRIVINTVTLENLTASVEALKDSGLVPDITLVNIARSTGVLDLTRLQSLNPVFIVSATFDKNEENV